MKLNDLEELEKDIQSHPERGRINGKLVLSTTSRKIELRLSWETYKRLILNASSEGEPVSTAALRLMKRGLSSSEEQGKVRQWVEWKASIYGVTIGEFINKVFGFHKLSVREQKVEDLLELEDVNE